MKSNRVRRTTSVTGITTIEVKRYIGWELKHAYRIVISKKTINAGPNKDYPEYIRKFVKLF